MEEVAQLFIRMILLKVFRPLKIIKHFIVPRRLVQILNPPQKFERQPFWNGWIYGIKKYGVEITFNATTSLLNLIKIYWAQK
jgi:hypothetical protein